VADLGHRHRQRNHQRTSPQTGFSRLMKKFRFSFKRTFYPIPGDAQGASAGASR
jgi:hypothetical protein